MEANNESVVLITGASRGIGVGLAEGFAVPGARLALTARRRTSLQETCRRVEALGAHALPLALDVRRLEDMPALVDQVEDELDPIQVLVNNAGVNIPRPAEQVTEEQWDEILDANLKGAFFLSQEVGRRMISRRRGTIVNVASAAGLAAREERAAYGSSKAGMIMLTRVLALEWAKHGITVNAVAPTFVETDLAAQTLDRPGMREKILGQIPLRRLATVEDVAASVLFLASPQASFLTGVVIPVDGGATLR